MGEGWNLAGRTAQAMIGHCAGDGEPVLNNVESVHRVLGRFYAAPLGERARAREVTFAAIEKIAVEREHDVSAVESRNQSHIFTEACPSRVILRLA